MPAIPRHRLLWLLSLVLAGSGVATILKAEPWICGQFAGHSPMPTTTAPADARCLAESLATRTPGAFALVGLGDSMEPLYPHGTVLVCAPRAYSELRRGETVLFRNRSDRLVAHLLLTHTRDGWRVRGLNNRWQDMEPVVPSNLVGVVIAAFVPEAVPATVRRLARMPGERPAFFASPLD